MDDEPSMRIRSDSGLVDQGSKLENYKQSWWMISCVTFSTVSFSTFVLLSGGGGELVTYLLKYE